MSFEFSNRIQQLTNKLTQIKQHKPKEDRIEQAKQQLSELHDFCNKELDNTSKRLKKIENKLKKRADRASSESESVEDIWGSKQERVGEVIGGWVNEYEQKMEQAFDDLNRQQLVFKTKLEEQQQKYEKQAKMMEDKITNQIKTLEKELTKWNNINSQHHSATLKEINSYKQALTRDLASSQQMKNKEIRNLELRIGKIKQQSTERMEQIKEKVDKYNLRTKQIFKLLLDLN